VSPPLRARALPALAGATLWLLPLGARAQQRPSEEEMFGGPPAAAPAQPPPAQEAPGRQKPAEPPPPPPPAEPPPPLGPPSTPPLNEQPPAAATEARDKALLGNPEEPPQLSAEAAPENPLTIGGQLYLRAQSTAYASGTPASWTLRAPNLIDVYGDARPNDRVRAFLLARTSYDPTVAVQAPTPTGTNTGASNSGTLPGTGFTTFNPSRGPNTVLDQAWIAFDIEHTVFVTAGKQHVRWGTGRFWTPTDFLHPLKRNPLDVFDARPGVSMLKLNVPWEERAWNFYAFGIIEDPDLATNTLGQVAGAGRAEFVEGAAELGLDFVARRGQKPLLGADLSVGVGDFDFYGDMGLRFGSDVQVVEPVAGMTPNPSPAVCDPHALVVDPTNVGDFVVVPSSGVKPQVVGGVNWSHKYNDNDVFTLGGEYFYNTLGYSSSSIYPGLITNTNPVTGATGTLLFTPFYLGRHYAAVFASFPAPYSWNYTTFTFSTIGNLSDQSFVSRIDYSKVFLTHLTFEAFAAFHYGSLGGEFRLPTAVVLPGQPPICTQAPLVDLGVALRVKL
jgi:hypothetical protein